MNVNNGINNKSRMIENTTIKARTAATWSRPQISFWQGATTKCVTSRCEPGSYVDKRQETPAKNWKSARASVGVRCFLNRQAKFSWSCKDVCTCMNLSLHSWFGPDLKEIGCHYKSEFKLINRDAKFEGEAGWRFNWVPRASALWRSRGPAH